MTNKKHVIIAQNASLVDHFGLTTYLKNIIQQLAYYKEYSVQVFPIKGSALHKKIKNITFSPLPGDVYSIKGNIIYSIYLYRKLKTLQEVDVIHCLYPVSSLISAALYKIFHNKSVRIVYDIRSPWIEMGMEKDLLPVFLKKFIRFICYKIESFLSKYVDEYIFITDGLHNHYTKTIHRHFHNVSIIPSGVDRNIFQNKGKSYLRKKFGLHSSDIIIGYAGTIQKTREMDFVINTFKNLLINDTRHKLVFVGDGDDKNHLETLTKNLDLENNIFFTGQVPYDEMPMYISGFDIGICHLPDRFVFRYSYPLKILEYLSCNIPAFCSNIQAHRDIADSLQNVYIYSDERSFETNIKNVEFKHDKNIKKYDWKNICDDIVETW